MKKIFATLMFLLACTAIQAQSADNIFEEFKSAQGAEYVPISKEMLSMAKDKQVNLIKGKLELGEDFASAISSMQVLDLGNCSKDIQGFVSDRVNTLKDHGYEIMINANDGDEKALILSKTKGDQIVEVLIFDTDNKDKDCALVQFKGSISKNALLKSLESKSK